MIAAFDVHYPGDGSAQAAAVVFEKFSDAEPLRIYRKKIVKTEEYRPGLFHKREMPCILNLYSEIEEPIDTVIIDGFVFLGDSPGLGKHLSDSLGPGIAVIGVAKTFFEGSHPVEANRGKSRRPLFITTHGLGPETARESIVSMHGGYRIPTLLKLVDRLSKMQDRNTGR